MKLYNAQSGNTKRVRIFIAEKGVDIPRIDVELGKDTRTPEFRKLNSLGEVPVLELDDGRVITEVMAICRYLESQFPAPALMGEDAYDIAYIEMWNLRMQNHIFMPHGYYVRHSIDLFSDVIEQIPAFAESQKKSIPEKWRWLESEMADGRPFITGDTFTIADITGMATLMVADVFNFSIPEDCAHVHRWADAMRARESWNA